MKLPIKRKYFDLIKCNEKKIEMRDAHITFVCEETGEQLRRDILSMAMVRKQSLPQSYYDEGILEDDKVIIFAFDLSSFIPEKVDK